MENCIFCKIAEGGIPSAKVYEDDDFFAFRDISPAAPTHVLVIPKRHIANVLEGLSQPGLMEGLLKAAAAVVRQEGLEQGGFRLVVNTGEDGGQSVRHLHLHVLGGRKMAWPPG